MQQKQVDRAPCSDKLPERPDGSRRKFLMATTGIAGSLAMVGSAVPFVASMLPSDRAKAAGAPVEVNLNGIAAGDLQTVQWRGKPVWVLHRTGDMLADIRKDDSLVADPASALPQQPKYAQNEYRSLRPDWLILIGVCTHLGCSPLFKPVGAQDMGAAWNGGFYCPCHGSKFDLAGRVIAGSPAPTNLVVPPYSLNQSRLVIGTAPQAFPQSKSHE